jgi:lipopolysaccharide export system protein LptA
LKYFSTLLIFFLSLPAIAQVNTDSINRIVRILESTRITNNATDSFIIATGTPLLVRHGTTLFKADSVFINQKSAARYMEAFGKVYINESDSVTTTAGYLKYYTDKKTAFLKNDVYIVTKGGTFSSPEVTYDLNSKMAYYKNGARIVSKRSVLTSKAGQYYSNSKDALFTEKVVLKAPEYDIFTDSLYYNVNSEIANFVTYTKVINKKKQQTIETTSGFYDMKKGIASFNERSIIKDSSRTIIADKIDIHEKEKRLRLEGRASITDTAKKEFYSGNLIEMDNINETYHIEGNGIYKNEKENFVITGNYLDGDGKTGRSIATGKPVAILKQENDSIFIAADTLFSGKIIQKTKIRTDSITKITRIDTLKNTKGNDSANRYFEGFHHVRIYSDSVQAVCDSIYYSDVDSVFRMYQHPVVWNDKNQITGDTMYLFTKNKKTDRVEVFEKAFIINRVEPKFYNQVRGSRITGYFTAGDIDSLFTKGNAEIIYYIQDEDKAFVGVDKSSADIIISYFRNKEINKIKWLNKYNAVTTPMKDVDHSAMRLRNFNLQWDKRPKSKFELFF